MFGGYCRTLHWTTLKDYTISPLVTTISSACNWNIFFIALNYPDRHQTLWGQAMAERSRCSSTKQRWGAMSSSNIKREGRVEGWGHENDWWEQEWQSCNREERGGREWRQTGDVADSWASLPVRPSLVFRLDLQVFNGTLARAVSENKNRCHKTPLRLGFASVMTPPEMLRVWCSQQKPVRYALRVVFITISAATSLLSLYLARMKNNLFLSSQHDFSVIVAFSSMTNFGFNCAWIRLACLIVLRQPI